MTDDPPTLQSHGCPWPIDGAKRDRGSIMDVTRLTVLQQLAAASDAARGETTTVASLASRLQVEEGTIEDHLIGLISCELARMGDGGDVRVTITGEELLALDTDEAVIVDSNHHPFEG